MKDLIITFLFLLGIGIMAPLAAFESEMDNTIVISSIQQTQETCNLGNGTLTILIDGDTTGMEFSIDAGSTYQSSNFFDNLQSGDYLIIVRSADSCSEVRSIQIADAPEPEVTTSTDCVPGRNLSNITPLVTGGIFPYDYEWTGGNGISNTDEILTRVPPGEYYLLVTDNLGCTIRDTVTIESCCELTTECNLPILQVACMTEMTELDTMMINALESTEIQAGLSDLGIIINDDPCGDVNISYQEAEENNPTSCADGPLIITRMITVSDSYLSFDCEQRIEVQNTIAPAITSMAGDIEKQCGDDLQAAFDAWIAEGAGMAVDGCTEPYTYTTLPAAPVAPLECGEEMEVLFVITDACGNEVSSTGKFSIIDNEDPVITCPTDLSLDDSDPNMDATVDNWIALVTTSDNCSSTAPTDDLDRALLEVACDQTLDLPVTFTTEDLCGNSSSCVTNIYIDGQPAAVVLSCGEDLVIDCSADRSALVNDWLTGFTGEDGAGNELAVENDLDLAVINNLDCNISTAVSFSIKDNCQRVYNCSREILVIDEVAPTINCPDRLILVSNDQDIEAQASAWVAAASASDNCSLQDFSNDFNPASLELDCDAALTVVVNFIAEDACNNLNSCEATIEIQSVAAPTMNCGEDLEISCNEDAVQSVEAWTAGFTAVDPDGNAIPVEVTLDAQAVEQLSCGTSLPAVFSITDNCDQVLDCSRIITVTDEVNPEITCPEQLEVSDTDSDPMATIVPWLAEASASDNCDPDPSLTHDFNTTNDWCSVSAIPVSFQVEDNCGNTNSCEAVITVTHSLPALTCPGPLQLNCGEAGNDQQVAVWMSTVNATGNDGNAITNDFTALALGSGCADEQIITFTTSNACNASVNCIGSITIIDEIAPEITCPSDLEVDLLDSNRAEQIAAWLGSATATDCNSYSISEDYDLDLSRVSCSDIKVITFTATDLCGLTSECEAKLSLTNSGTIEITCPEYVEYRCADPQLLYKIETHIAQVEVTADNSFDVQNDFNPIDFTPGDCPEENLEIEVRAIDGCGNKANCFIEIGFLPGPEIYVPNVISPDNDGLNDYFTAFGNEAVDYIGAMTIFNKWGSKIYEATDLPINEETSGWDGRYGTEEETNNVYTYHLVIIDTFGNEIDKAGTVQIIK